MRGMRLGLGFGSKRVIAVVTGGALEAANRALALTLTGIDYSLAKPRTPLTQKAGVDPLPTNVFISGTQVRFTGTGATPVVSFNNWDFTGYTVYADSGTLTFTDCLFSTATGASTLAILSAGTTVTCNFCEFDGQKHTTSTGNLVAYTKDDSTGGSATMTNCTFHNSPTDMMTGGSNLTIDRCYFHDGGYVTGAHFDFTQLATGTSLAYSNCTYTNSLFDGSTINAAPLNNAVRAIATNNSTLTNVKITGNVLISKGVSSPPLSLGTRTGTAVGLSSSNFTVENNYGRFESTSGLLYSGTNAPPTGYAVWGNNRQADTLAALAVPTGWQAPAANFNAPVNSQYLIAIGA